MGKRLVFLIHLMEGVIRMVSKKIKVKKFDYAYPCLPKKKASILETKLKSRYEIIDYETEDKKGYLIKDKKKNAKIIFSPNSRLTLETRYLEKDENKRVTENVLDLFARVAVNIATADLKYDAQTNIEKVAEEFLEIMIYKEFIPNTPTLCNAGRSLQQLSACFVIPVEDYMATDDIGEDPKKQGMGIYDALRYTAMIHKSGGGTGFNFSYLRPRNDRITTTFGYSSGPISFIKTFDASTEAVNQGGFRRGANMGIMEYWHPDIFEFVHEKLDGTLKNFNLSVGVDNYFMKLVTGDDFYQKRKEKEYFKLINPKNRNKLPIEDRTYKAKDLFKQRKFDDSEEGKRQKREYFRHFEESNPSLLLSEDGNRVLNRYNGEEVGHINKNGEVLISAKKLFNYIIDVAWTIGCPGMIFFDTINKDNPTPQLGRIMSTNPCGEQPLLPFEACNLGAINLVKCIQDIDGKKGFDYNKLEYLARNGVHFLDNVIDMNCFPFKRIYHMAKGNRKIGLGMMGWGEALFMLGIPYDSDEALHLAEKVTKFITEKARESSVKLVEKRGVFPNWKGSIYEKNGLRVRNATVTTIAPNGTTGMIADASSGIEPSFSLYYEKNCMDGRKLSYKVESFEKELKKRGLFSKEILAKIKTNEGRIQEIDEIPDEIKKVYKTALDISPKYHIKMQAAFQRWIDNAVSKTVNLPFDTTKEDIAEIYINAWKLGCKGITIFRDRSIEIQVLSAGKNKNEIELVNTDVTPPKTLDVAVKASKYTIRRARSGDTLHIIIRDKLYIDDKNNKAYFLPYETFCERAPIGASQSVDFQMSGLDRSVIFKSYNPDYAEQIIRWKSPSTAEEEEGIGPTKLKSKHHAFALAVEYHLLSAGVVAYDKVGKLYNIVRKRDLREVVDFNEEREILSGNRLKGIQIEQNISGNIKLGSRFECAECGNTEYYFESGCHSPKCLKCGWNNGGCG